MKNRRSNEKLLLMMYKRKLDENVWLRSLFMASLIFLSNKLWPLNSFWMMMRECPKNIHFFFLILLVFIVIFYCYVYTMMWYLNTCCCFFFVVELCSITFWLLISIYLRQKCDSHRWHFYFLPHSVCQVRVWNQHLIKNNSVEIEWWSKIHLPKMERKRREWN